VLGALIVAVCVWFVLVVGVCDKVVEIVLDGLGLFVYDYVFVYEMGLSLVDCVFVLMFGMMGGVGDFTLFGWIF